MWNLMNKNKLTNKIETDSDIENRLTEGRGVGELSEKMKGLNKTKQNKPRQKQTQIKVW